MCFNDEVFSSAERMESNTPNATLHNSNPSATASHSPSSISILGVRSFPSDEPSPLQPQILSKDDLPAEIFDSIFKDNQFKYLRSVPCSSGIVINDGFYLTQLTLVPVNPNCIKDDEFYAGMLNRNNNIDEMVSLIIHREGVVYEVVLGGAIEPPFDLHLNEDGTIVSALELSGPARGSLLVLMWDPPSIASSESKKAKFNWLVAIYKVSNPRVITACPSHKSIFLYEDADGNLLSDIMGPILPYFHPSLDLKTVEYRGQHQGAFECKPGHVLFYKIMNNAKLGPYSILHKLQTNRAVVEGVCENNTQENCSLVSNEMSLYIKDDLLIRGKSVYLLNPFDSNDQEPLVLLIRQEEETMKVLASIYKAEPVINPDINDKDGQMHDGNDQKDAVFSDRYFMVDVSYSELYEELYLDCIKPGYPFSCTLSLNNYNGKTTFIFCITINELLKAYYALVVDEVKKMKFVHLFTCDKSKIPPSWFVGVSSCGLIVVNDNQYRHVFRLIEF